MPHIPTEFQSSKPWPDLLTKAAEILSREAPSFAQVPLEALSSYSPGAASANPGGMAELSALAGRICPVTGVSAPLENPLEKMLGNLQKAPLRQQAHEIINALFTMTGQSTGPREGQSATQPPFGSLPSISGKSSGKGAEKGPGTTTGKTDNYAGRTCSYTGSMVPFGEYDRDQLRRQAHAFIETLLITFNDATGEKGLPTEDQVPLLSCVAPVRAGDEGSATLRVENEEDSPSDVSLYCSNFIADSGFEIPSLRISVSPRRITIPAKGQAIFNIKIAVAQQTPRGVYSGLIQAAGCKYVKAVLSVEVL